MSPEKREEHMRRMLDHGQKVREQFKRDNAQFEKDCRTFWDFMRKQLSQPIS